MKRILTSSAIILSEIILVGITQPSIAGSNESARPNILFCIADDASYHHFKANGCNWVTTPAFDKVAKNGILFTNTYTPNAKCAPSRSCILTGRNSWQLREAANHNPLFPSEIEVFTEALQNNGYAVAYTGKGWSPGDPGIKDGQRRKLTGVPFQALKTTPPTKGINSTNYSGNFTEFLNTTKPETPWFFWFGSHEPHRSYEYKSGITKGGKNIGMIDHVPAYWPDNDTIRTDMLDYAFEIEYFDKQVGAMLDELDKRKLLDNTLVVITSDNGMPFPRSKANDYEYSNHMPLAMMWKNGIAKPGRTVTDYVSFIDFAPTFMDISGTDWAKSGMLPASGHSLKEIFKSKKSGRVTKSREYMVLGRERDDQGRPANQGYPIRAIIRNQMLYMTNMKPSLYPAGNPETGYLDCDGSPTKSFILNLHRSGQDSSFWNLSFGFRPEEEMYDLKNDIDCMKNLAKDPQYIQQKSELRTILFNRLKAEDDPRVVGDGNIFDNYKYDNENKWNFWERVQSGEVPAPWKLTGWVSPTDYEIYSPKETDDSKTGNE